MKKSDNEKLRKEQERELKKQAQDKIVGALDDAADTLIRLSRQQQFPKIALAASQDILDRGLGKAKQQLPEDEFGNQINPVQIFEAMMKAKEMTDNEIAALPDGGHYNEEGTYIIDGSINYVSEDTPEEGEDDRPELGDAGVISL